MDDREDDESKGDDDNDDDISILCVALISGLRWRCSSRGLAVLMEAEGPWCLFSRKVLAEM